MPILNEVKLGDKIRSYDFAGINHCYYEGVIDSIDGGTATFTATTTKRVWDGNDIDIKSNHFTTSLPGMGMFDDIWTDRIEIISEVQ